MEKWTTQLDGVVYRKDCKVMHKEYEGETDNLSPFYGKRVCLLNFRGRVVRMEHVNSAFTLDHR
jgi:hypothetical protein